MPGGFDEGRRDETGWSLLYAPTTALQTEGAFARALWPLILAIVLIVGAAGGLLSCGGPEGRSQ